MVKIGGILEERGIFNYLQSRGLIKQYQKAKRYLLNGNVNSTKFKERNPKGEGIWYFRINKQYRALGIFDEEENLIIFKIDNHQ